MTLELTVLRCPDSVVPEARTVSGGEFTVGRGPGVDWILPDGDRLLSKRHFALAFRSGSWQLADTSTNGTFVNTDDAALGSGEVRTLRNGDRIRLGTYEIEVRLTEDAYHGGNFGSPAPGRADPFGDPFGMDPLAPPPPAHRPFGGDVHTREDVAPILPEDDFLQVGHPGGRGGYDPFANPVQSDHSSVMQDAFQPQAPSGMEAMHTGGIIPGDNLLPDDWDNDLLAGIGAPAVSQPPPAMRPPAPPPVFAPPPVARPAAPPPQAPAPAPVARQAPPPQPLPLRHAVEADSDASPFDEPSDLIDGPHRLDAHGAPLAVARPEPSAPAAFFPAADTGALPDFADLEPPPPPPVAMPARPVAAPPARSAPPPAARSTPPPAARTTPPPAAEASRNEAGLMAAFMEGADMSDIRPPDPEATMRALGAAFRAVVAGLRGVLIARASIKSEFRIEQTMIRARGNNPLKFSAGDDDALSALLGTGRRVDMAPAAAVTDALRDIRLHELASMAAMQSAVRALMEGLDPAKLRAAAEQGGGLAVLPAQRKARAWDAFEALHTKTLQALSDDFDSVFGKAFARAYERAMDEVSERERE